MTIRQEIDPGWTWDDRFSYSQAVKLGNWVYVSGQLSLDPQGNVVGKGDLLAQSRQVFQNIEAILGTVGGTREQIVRITAYLTDMTRFSEYNRARAEFFQKNRPASTSIQVSGLAIEGLLVEVDAVAYVE